MTTKPTTPTLPPTDDEAREADSIMRTFGGDMRELHRLVDAQLTVIHHRAQSLIALGSVVITVTGFSGRIIADTNDYAQALIILGISLVGVAAVITLLFVLPIRWLTSYMDLPPRDWLLVALQRRKRKNKAFRVALWFMAAGMIFYIASIAVMLMYPEATELNRVR